MQSVSHWLMGSAVARFIGSKSALSWFYRFLGTRRHFCLSWPGRQVYVLRRRCYKRISPRWAETVQYSASRLYADRTCRRYIVVTCTLTLWLRVANVPSRLRLRSSNSDQLMVPSYNLTTVGRRAFPVFAANLWNSLPVNLTSALSITIFWQRLETRLFRCSYPDLIIWHSD